MTILPFDEDTARVYAPLRAKLERAGASLRDSDLQIAAIALSRGLRP